MATSNLISRESPIREIMHRDVVTIRADADLKEAWEALSHHRISGAPVTDIDGSVIGVLSQHDLLMCIVSERTERFEERSYYQALPAIAEGFFPSGDRVEEVLRVRAREVMTPRIVSVSPDETVGEVAKILRRNRMHRVLVQEGRNLVGIVSTYDLLAILDK